MRSDGAEDSGNNPWLSSHIYAECFFSLLASVGSYVAEASLYIALSRLIWGLDFQPVVDPVTGKPNIPDVHSEETFGDGFVSSPCMFDLSIRPRSEKHAVTIRRLYEDAQNEFLAMGLAKDDRVVSS